MKKQKHLLGIIIAIIPLILSGCNSLLPNRKSSNFNSSRKDDESNISMKSEEKDTSSKHTHTFGEWEIVTAPTCSFEGLEERTCATCGYKETRSIDRLEHTWGEWEIVTASTCNVKGTERRRCVVCDIEEMREIDYTDHYWTEWIVKAEATCISEGTEERECIYCQCKESRSILPSGHKYGEWVVKTAATCTNQGLEERICSVCQQIETRTIEALGHSFGDWVTLSEATCTARGQRKRQCTRCDNYQLEAIPATGHKYEIKETVKAPTCTEKGSIKKVCSICNDEITEEVSALGHDYVLKDHQEPMVNYADIGLYECSRCKIRDLRFKATDLVEESKNHVVIEENSSGEQGVRFWGRPIGNAMPLDESGSADPNDHEAIYDNSVVGDYFEYKFNLTEEQATEFASCYLYCDAKPADWLGRNNMDFWACREGDTEWTQGYYIDDNPAHYNEDGSPKPIDNFRYLLYVDGAMVDFDPSIKVPVPQSEDRADYVMPYLFHLHAGDNMIRLVMTGGFRSIFYNFSFRSVSA